MPTLTRTSTSSSQASQSPPVPHPLLPRVQSFEPQTDRSPRDHILILRLKVFYPIPQHPHNPPPCTSHTPPSSSPYYFLSPSRRIIVCSKSSALTAFASSSFVLEYAIMMLHLRQGWGSERRLPCRPLWRLVRVRS
jgi:hypothetical protein